MKSSFKRKCKMCGRVMWGYSDKEFCCSVCERYYKYTTMAMAEVVK